MPFTIPEQEIDVKASRASGPGGQHVNTSATRVEVRWNVAESPSVSDAQRVRLMDRLRSRIDRQGNIRVTASARRSQLRNRDAAIARLHELVREALAPTKPRKRTAPPAAARERRLVQKRRRAETKRRRRPVDESD